MLKTANICQGRTVKDRACLVVAFVTLFFAAMLCLPGFAYADDEVDMQQESQTQEIVDQGSSLDKVEDVTPATGDADTSTDTTEVDSASENGVASIEQVEKTTEVTEELVVSESNASLESDASNKESDVIDSELEESTETSESEASTSESSDQVDNQGDTIQDNIDSYTGSTTVVDFPENPSYTPTTEDEPAIQDEVVDASTEQASTNLGNDPPEQASENEASSSDTNDTNITNLGANPQASNVSGISVASTEEIDPAASGEIEIQADFNYTLRFHTDQFVASGGATSVTGWGTPGEGVFGSDHDFIYDENGKYIATVGSTFEIAVVGSDARPPVLLRHGYEIAYIYVKRPNANTYLRSTYTGGKMQAISGLAVTVSGGMFNGATLDAYIQWGTGSQKTVNYFYNGIAKQNELNNQYSGMTLKTPDSLGAYTLDNEGWYLLQDLDYNSATGVYTAKPGRENYDFTSANDIWDLFSYYISTYYNGGTTGFKAGEDRDVTKIYNTAAGTLTLYAGKKSVVASPQFGVIYEKGSSDSGATTEEQKYNISDASKTNTKTASEVNFTKAGYSFKGWASSATNATAGTLYVAGGVPFSNIASDLGTGDKIGANAIHLYPIWHQDTYTVEYHANGGGGSYGTPNPVTYHSVGSSTTDKAGGQGGITAYTKTGYTVTFDGWNTKADGTGTSIAANASLAKVNNGSAPVDGGAYHLYAVWTETADTFKVTYKATGSTSGSDSTVTYNVKDAGSTNFPSGTTQGLSKTGYDFAGWSRNSGATTPDAGLTTAGTLSALSPAKDQTYTIFPVWTPKNYTVNWVWRYNASGSALTGYSTTTNATYGSSTPIANDTPSSPAVGSTVIESNVQYTFKGWYLKRSNAEWKSATGTTPLNTSTHNLTTVLADADTKTDNSVTIWGIWDSANQVTITYVENKPGQSSEVTYSTVDRTYAGTTFNIKNTHPEETGYTFLYWSTDKNDASTGTRYANPALSSPAASNTITPTGNIKLYAIWKVHSVKFALAPGTTDTVDLKQKSTLPSTTKTVGQSISWNDLVTATPTREGYDFAGFQGEYATSATTTATFTINGSSPTSWTVLASAAATDGATITLTAQWTPTVYYVRYNANKVASDSGNTVKFWKGTTQVSQVPYAVNKQNGTGSDLIYTTTGLDTFGGLSDPTYGDSEGDWYTFGGWGSTSSATNPINSGDSFSTLYNAQTHATDKYLELYAIWTPITINIKYTTEDSSKGTVAPAAKTNISLAVASTGYGSTATPATPSGLSVSPYQLAKPTWTYEGTANTTGISFGIPANAQQASYMPDLSVLRKLYLAGERNAEFQAHFEPRDFGYEIRIYTEQTDGTYNTAATTSDNFASYLRTNAPDGNTLTASYGTGNTKVNATTAVVPGTSTTLADWALTKTYASTGIAMNKLFEFVAGMGGKNEITISTVESNNVIELYYKRKTYDLTASYEGKPSTVTDVAADHLSKTSGIRWGETVALTTPAAANYNGYTFAWGADVPANATVTTNSFKLDEAAFANLSSKANVKGVFTEREYVITLDRGNDGSNNGATWNTGSVARLASQQTDTKTLKTSETLGSWVPTSTDSTSVDYFFVGWHDQDDTANPQSTVANLSTLTNWTAPKTFVALWMQKITVAYESGDLDSQNRSKAAWTSTSIKPSIDLTTAKLLSEITEASFDTLVGSLDNGNPAGAAGWEFDYWEWKEAPAGYDNIYGHRSGYDTTHTSYIYGDTSFNGISVSNSITLIAHWKAKPVAVTVNASGAVANNSGEYTTSERVTIAGNATSGRTYGAQTENNTYKTDDEVDLADFAPVTVPTGYQLVGWTVTDGGTTKTYAPTAKIRLGTDAVELWPVFDEDTVTFTYKLDTASAGRSSFATETDTVYVVKHNGVTAHTVTLSDTHAYKFAGWKLDAEATSDFDVTDATIDKNASVFTSLDYTKNHTFYAHIDKQKYTVTFAKPGKFDDGSNAPAGNGASVKNGTEGAGMSNDITVEWGDSIPNDSLDLVVPMGYKLAGWFEGDSSTTNVTYGTGDLAGIYQRAITDDITLYPHFTIDTNAQFKVVYDYGQAAGTGTHQADKMVIWTANVLPDATSDQRPTVPGYSFDNWYVDADHTQTVGDAGQYFNYIWNDPNVDRDVDNKTITIHLNMNPKTYTVNYDINGGDSDPIPSKSGVKWADAFGDSANGFKPADPTRNGYTFGGWTVSWSDGTETWDNGGNIVANNDTYSKLSKNGTDAGTVTLVAKWNAAQLPVTYVFADGSTSNYTGNFEWDRDYNYLLAYAVPAPTTKPTRTGFIFDGWTVTYNTSEGMQTGTSINDTNPTSSIKTMVGDKSGWSNLTLTANWKQEVNWQFQDVLVDRDGNEHDGDASLSQQGVVGQTIKHADSYTPHAAGYYEGYDFDQYVAVLGTVHSAKTAEEVSLPVVAAGTTYIYKVYYIERAYDIVFRKAEGDTSAYGTTNANPWTSANAILPGTDPTQTGKNFDGWYVKRADGSEHKLDTTLAAALSTAPGLGTTIEAYAKWSDQTATISWTADSNGSVANAATAGSSATRTATDTTNGVGAITATPNTNYDFEKWVYSTDGGTTWNDVTTASGVATLSGADANGRYTELTPIPFKATGDTEAIWHDIAFKAQFVGSGSMNITIEHYKENANWKTGDPDADRWTKTETTGTSGDGETFTATPQTFAGYTLDTTINTTAYGQTRQSGTTLAGDGATETASRIFRLYYTADSHDITYRYVLASDNSQDQTPPSGAPLLPATGSAKTDQTYKVADAPTFAGWEFSGWYESTNYGGTAFGGNSATMGTTDVVYVGTWKRLEKSVTFTNGGQGQVTMSPTSGYVVAVGDKVKTAIPTGNAETLQGLGVNWSASGAAITLAGWDVYENGVKVSSAPIGISDPLDYVITEVTEFRAAWSETYNVQYTRGAHGTFTDKNNTTIPKAEYVHMLEHTPWTSVSYEAKGTVDNSGDSSSNPNYDKPNAADGWTFVGWGSHDSNGVWTYYFDYDGDVDYGTATVTNYGYGAAMPTEVTQNWEFIAFFKPQTRTLIFSNEKPLSPHGNFSPVATKKLDDGDYTMDVKTGEKPILLGVNSLERKGYTLVGWRTEAGGATYLPGSNDTFVMPELPLSGSVTLYPIFALDQLTITYGVDPDCQTGTAWWGGVSNTGDTIRNEGDTISGSIATANNGYVFEYWYKVNVADPTDKTPITDGTFDSDTGKLTPTESGTYLAHFKQKTYEFQYVDAYGTEDVTTYPVKTMPTDPANAVWTDNVTIGTPTRPGFDFLGWDVYDVSDWDAINKAYDPTATGAARVGKLRNVRAAGTYQVSQITDVAGDQVSLVLVAVWGKEKLHVIYDANGGDWSNDKDDYPATEGVVPTSTNVATDAALQYNTEVGDSIDVRTDKSVSQAGKRLVGWKYVELSSGAEVAGSEQYFYINQADYVASTETAKHLVSDGFKMPTQSVKLVAIWADKAGYEVTFDVNGGDAGSAPANRGGASDPVKWTDSIDLKKGGSVPTYAGKTFLGWTIKNGDGVVLGNTDAPANYVNANSMAFNLLAQNVDSSANAHLTLVANWADKAYTVTFDVNGGEASTKPNDYTATDNLQWDDPVTLQQANADPTYVGHKFTGWKVYDKNNNAIQSGGTDLVIAAGTASKPFSELALTDTDDTTALKLVAQWDEIDDYTVTFIDRPVTDTATDAVTNMPANIAAADGLKWGGSVNTWKDGADKPARAGYAFMGWDVYKVDPTTAGATAIGTVAAADATKAYSAMADADTTKALWLVAKWEESGDYNVVFLPGDATGATKVDMTTMPADQTNITYAKTGISTAAPTRPGYTFKGWKSSVTNADVAAATTSIDYKTLAGNDSSVKTVTLTADWEANTDYKVIYADGVTSGKPFTGTLPTPNPREGLTYDAADIANPDLAGMRDGYDFAGWAVTRDDTGDLLANIINYSSNSVYSALAGDVSIKVIKLTAQWKVKSYGVTYHLTDGTWQPTNINDIPTGGTADSKVPVNVDATYTVRAADTVTRSGYTLLGWQTEANGGTKYEFDGTSAFTMPAADVDLYPIWKANDYAVTFVANEPVGTATNKPDDKDSIAYDATVTYGAPDLSGFDFKGWNVYKTADWTASGASATPLYTELAAGSNTYANLAKDPDVTGLTFVAQWDAKSFYVQYHSGSTATEPVVWHADKIAADAMGALNNPDNPIYYKTGVTVTMRGQDTLTANGKRLAGWKDGTDAGATKYLFETHTPFTFVMPASNVNLYPIWTIINDYTVAFEDGIAALDPTKIAAGATAQNMPTTPQTGLAWTSDVNTQAPSLAGWKFKGWTVYDNGAPKAVIGGTDASPKTGVTYTFNNLALADLAERHDLTLVANWELDARYVVTFLDGVLAGETTPVTDLPYETEAVPHTKSGLAFTDAVAHTAAKRAGYTFDGWSVKAFGVTGDGIALADVAAGTTAYNLLTGDAPGNPAYVRLELTAKWIAKNIYKVSFKSQPDTDTGSTAVVGLPPILTDLMWESDVYAGSATDPVAPTRAGYTFDHWAIQDITAGTDPANIRNIGRCPLGNYKYSALAGADTVEHVLMTAVWVANTWKVTYVDESGVGNWVVANIPADDKAHPGVNAGTYAVDEAVTVRGANVMTRTGYTLVGWATTSANAAAGNADAVDFAMPDNDVELFAVWVGKTYTVHFLENKPAAATDPLQVVAGMPYETEAAPFTKTGLGWNDTVNTQHPTLPGYVFAGWVVKDAAALGAKTGTLDGTSYTYDELALDDATSELTLVALWEAGTYRLIYVDPTDAAGAVAPTQVENFDNVLWNGDVAIDDPWTLAPAYAVKDAADWQFDGWTIVLTDGSIAKLSAADDLSYAALAARTGLTVADVATATDVPALTLTATWTRRVPFVVDFVKVAVDGTHTVVTPDAETLVGLDGDNIALVWANTVLDLGNTKTYPGYAYNRVISTPNVVGVLAATQLTDGLLHVELLFEAVTDYVVTYDANGIQTSVAGAVADATGAYLVADLTRATTTKTAASPAWDSLASGFEPVNSEWAKTGYRLDHWYYVAADGSRHDFDGSMTFAEIAEAIYGTVDGTEGLSTLPNARPVTLFAAWVEKNEYKVVYDDNYTTDYTTKPEGDGYIDGKFIPDTYETPTDKNDVAWNESDLEPTDADVIVEPGRDLVHDKDGNLASLYELEGWNYSTDGGVTQHPADGMTFAEIAHEIYGDNEPEEPTIRLFARWREIDIELKYQPRNVKSDENGNLVLEGGEVVLLDGTGNGTVSRGSETVSAVTGNRNIANPKLIADGATAEAAPGYHFVGWMRESDGKIIYAPGMDPASLSTMSAASVARLFAMAEGDGLNVLPGTIANAMTAFQAEQNASDGYWHDETYLALFAANAIAVLHYDKNAEDATGEIPDVEAPWGSILALSDGSGFTRTYWTLTGWNTEADGSGTPYALSETGWVMPEDGDTLYAMWKKNLATLTYDPGADDVTGVPEDETDEWGTIVETAEGTPKRPHYTFLGWNTAKDGTGTWIPAGTELELLPEGVTLYAQWDLNTYEATGGEPTEGGTLRPYDPIDIEHGGHLPEGYLVAVPEDGWHVSGWRYVLVDENGRTWTGTVSDPSELPITGKVTFTPIFEKDVVEQTVEDKTGVSYAANDVVGGTMPQTGDALHVSMLLTLMAAAFAILLLAVLMMRRREEEEEA